MSQSPEKFGVELPAINWLIRLGYTHLPGNQLQVEHRHLAPIMDDVLQARLLILNPWLATTPGGISAVLIELRKRVNDELLPANKAFWEQVVNRSNIQVKDVEGKPRSVRFFDASDTKNNDFHVVDQYVGRNADEDVFRPDLLLFVNGLPLAIIANRSSAISCRFCALLA